MHNMHNKQRMNARILLRAPANYVKRKKKFKGAQKTGKR